MRGELADWFILLQPKILNVYIIGKRHFNLFFLNCETSWHMLTLCLDLYYVLVYV